MAHANRHARMNSWPALGWYSYFLVVESVVQRWKHVISANTSLFLFFASLLNVFGLVIIKSSSYRRVQVKIARTAVQSYRLAEFVINAMIGYIGIYIDNQFCFWQLNYEWHSSGIVDARFVSALVGAAGDTLLVCRHLCRV